MTPIELFTQIQHAYQNPIRSNSNEPGYCVGLAFILAMGHESDYFPTRERLTAELDAYNALDIKECSVYASCIINMNDAGKFPQAWYWLRSAMCSIPVRIAFDALAIKYEAKARQMSEQY